MLFDVNTKMSTAAFSDIVLNVWREMHCTKAFYMHFIPYKFFISFLLFIFITKNKMHIFLSFFLFLLSPRLFCVDRCFSGLKIANDIMGECARK